MKSPNKTLVKEIEKINQLTHEEMARLWRFSPSGHPYFVMGSPLWEAFEKRWKEFGGMNPTLSKKLGWG